MFSFSYPFSGGNVQDASVISRVDVARELKERDQSFIQTKQLRIMCNADQESHDSNDKNSNTHGDPDALIKPAKQGCQQLCTKKES